MQPADASAAPFTEVDRPATANVLGVGVHAVDMPEAVSIIDSAIRCRSASYVCATGMHGVMEAQRDRCLHRALAQALLNVPDGIPTVWAGRLQGHRTMRQVPGPELMLEVCRVSAERGYTQFFYGGNDGVAEELARALTERFPGLRVAGTYTPPFRPLSEAESDALRSHIAEIRPDIFWVGLSTPKQEMFMSGVGRTLDVGVSIGVGAAFDFHTGRLQYPPPWIRRAGLQWAYRIRQEPRRLWKRYFFNIPPFLFRLLLQFSGLGKSQKAGT